MGAHHVVVVGGGFAGLRVVRGLRHAPVRVTLVDRRNFHLFQPLLYQVATGGLSPANIAAPLRTILRHQRNARVVLAEALGLDAAGRRLVLARGHLDFDTLVVASGASHHYFGNDGWAALAPGLKTVEDATEIRRRVLGAFEAAETETDAATISALMTFVVVGAGPTGVELAGALAEIARDTLAREFREIEPSLARIVLVEGEPRVLPGYPEGLSARATRFLLGLGVEVRPGCLVTDVGPDGVTIGAHGWSETVAARTVLWAAGVQASPLGAVVAAATGTTTDRAGRVKVGPDLSVPGHPSIFVIGDLAHVPGPGGPLPGVAQVAMQQGDHVARVLRRRARGKAVRPFRYRDYGSMATIGRHAAVAEIAGLRLSGNLAWLLWLFVHLMKMVTFQNRVLVFVQWAWSYLTFNRAARLITETARSARGAAREPTSPAATAASPPR